jgi:pimeloyl-ACP methyl ester carboxylesterase
VVTETDVELPDGRTLHVYDTAGEDGRLAVLWHHGTPNLDPPPEPLFPAADRLGIRWVSHDRPGYGGSTPHPGRDLASGGPRLAPGARQRGLSPVRRSGPGVPHGPAVDGDGPDHDDVDDDNEH